MWFLSLVAQLHHLHTWRPTKVLHSSSFTVVTVLVNISAELSSVWIFSNLNTFSSRSKRMKWCLMSMCFVLAWNAEFFARWIVLWLSLCNLLFSYFFPNSFIKFCNQAISLLASVAAIYSASILESATIYCNYDTQLIAVEPNVKTYFVVLLRLSKSPDKSEST